MIRNMRCLMRWCLYVKRLSEEWLRKWSRCVSQLRNHRLRKCGLKLNTLRLEWRYVKLKLSLLKASLRVYSTLHLSYLGLLLYSRMHMFLSPGLCWWSLWSLDPGTIGCLLKFHPPQRLLIICIISAGGLKVCLFTQIHPSILEYSSEKAAIGGVHGSCSRNMRSCTSSSNIPRESVSLSKRSPRGMPQNRRPCLGVCLVAAGWSKSCGVVLYWSRSSYGSMVCPSLGHLQVRISS